MTLETRLRRAAINEGFTLCGIAPAVSSDGFANLIEWIDAGFAAGMTYFDDRRQAYAHPHAVLDGVRSIVVLAMPYASGDPPPASAGYGRLARYVWDGHDYHDVIHPKLKRLCGLIRDHSPDAAARGIVDTAPLMEREFAQLAGLGWRAKNTLLIRPGVGSYFFLACVLTSVELKHDEPFGKFHCGTCTACLDACPTDAFDQPGVLNAGRCISYLTIEHREAIPIELREKLGDWLFGCDVCQEVCPWNRKSRDSHRDVAESCSRIELRSLFEMDDDGFRRRFRKTPLWRAKRRGILRNAAIVLGNQVDSQSMPALVRGLHDREPLVRGACAWALGRLGDQTTGSLRDRQRIEDDQEVAAEITAALA